MPVNSALAQDKFGGKMEGTSKYLSVIKLLMPENAKFIKNEQSNDYAISISWNINNDSKRPNKQ